MGDSGKQAKLVSSEEEARRWRESAGAQEREREKRNRE
jgi:hypothetical protein